MARQLKGPSKTGSHVTLILRALQKARGPKSAYELIEAVRPEAILAPPTVYRALEALIKDGRVHKVESLNAFVACTHAAHHDDAAFAVCDSCGAVTEFDAPEVLGVLTKWSRKSGFKLETQKVEIHGKCTACNLNKVMKQV